MVITVAEILTLVTGIIAAMGLTTLIAAASICVIAVSMLMQLIDHGR